MAEHLSPSAETYQDTPILRECDMTNPTIREKLFVFDEEIQNQMRREGHELQYEPMNFAAWNRMIEGCRVFDLESPSGEVLGYVGISPTPDYVAERLITWEAVTSSQALQIVTIAASPGKSYGKLLLKEIEEIALEGYSDIWLYVSPYNKRARESYEHREYICRILTSYYEMVIRGPQDHEDKLRQVYSKHIQDLPNDPMGRAWRENQNRSQTLVRLCTALDSIIKGSTDANKFSIYNPPEESYDIWQKRVLACMRTYGEDNNLPPDYNPHDHAEELLERFVWHGLYRYRSFGEVALFFSSILNTPLQDVVELQKRAKHRLYEADSEFTNARKMAFESRRCWQEDIPKYR